VTDAGPALNQFPFAALVAPLKLYVLPGVCPLTCTVGVKVFEPDDGGDWDAIIPLGGVDVPVAVPVAITAWEKFVVFQAVDSPVIDHWNVVVFTALAFVDAISQTPPCC
jgi:hypothetical protein